jgi:hypothetical protein
VGLRDLSEQWGAYDRRDDQAVRPGFGLFEQVVGQHAADIVSGEDFITLIRNGGDSQTTGIGIVGEHQLRTDPLGQRKDVHHGRGLSWIGELDGGKPAVGFRLRGEAVEAGKPSGPEDRPDQSVSDPVKRRVGNWKAASFRGGAYQGTDSFAIPLHQVIQSLHAPMSGRFMARPSGNVGSAVDAGDLLRDALVVRGDDLRTVAPKHFVTAVGRRTMASGDHHARGSTGLQNGKR